VVQGPDVSSRNSECSKIYKYIDYIYTLYIVYTHYKIGIRLPWARLRSPTQIQERLCITLVIVLNIFNFALIFSCQKIIRDIEISLIQTWNYFSIDVIYSLLSFLKPKIVSTYYFITVKYRTLSLSYFLSYNHKLHDEKLAIQDFIQIVIQSAVLLQERKPVLPISLPLIYITIGKYNRLPFILTYLTGLLKVQVNYWDCLSGDVNQCD
jgi:hypothetical protein